MSSLLLLAIESSCDESAVAIVRVAQPGGRPEILADTVLSQAAIHARFGGVVPEIASREHINAIAQLTEQALNEAGVTLSELGAIAVTVAPGLIGALFVGTQFAKGLCVALKIPLIEVNHLEGHLAACDLLETRPPFPHLALLVSGGHTTLYEVKAPFEIESLGTTIDDAAGEAFDKTAKMLGFPYPGGAQLSKMAAGGARDFVKLPIGRDKHNPLNFSFSGLKTAVSLFLNSQSDKTWIADHVPSICASIESAIVEALTQRVKMACEQRGIHHVVLAGGVAANGYLRERLTQTLTPLSGTLYAPPVKWCTDNAVMIAAAGVRRYEAGKIGSLTLLPRAYEPLSEAF